MNEEGSSSWVRGVFCSACLAVCLGAESVCVARAFWFWVLGSGFWGAQLPRPCPCQSESPPPLTHSSSSHHSHLTTVHYIHNSRWRCEVTCPTAAAGKGTGGRTDDGQRDRERQTERGKGDFLGQVRSGQVRSGRP